MGSYRHIIVVNIQGVVVRYDAPLTATVRQAADFAIKRLLGDSKTIDSYRCQVSLHGMPVGLDNVLAKLVFNVGDMLNIEFF